MHNNFFLEKIDYEKIYAHRDWDGVIGSGLLLRVFDLPISFLNRVDEAVKSVIVEVPFSLDAYVEKCLVIDHHDCKREPLKSLHFGNHVICDENYSSVASLIVDYFDLDTPEEILDALDLIEMGEIDRDDLAYKMFISFVSDMNNFPYMDFARAVKMGDWDRIIRWVDNKSSSKDAELVVLISKNKLKNRKELIDGVQLITYNVRDKLDVGAARLALLELEKTAKIGIIIGVDDIYARYGVIATKKKKINLIQLFHELNRMSWKAGGRSRVGGFQIPYELTLDQAISMLKEAFLGKRKEINL